VEVPPRVSESAILSGCLDLRTGKLWGLVHCYSDAGSLGGWTWPVIEHRKRETSPPMGLTVGIL
jgi:hypothetical protein